MTRKDGRCPKHGALRSNGVTPVLNRQQAFEGDVAPPRDPQGEFQTRLTRPPLDHREMRHRALHVLGNLHQRFVPVVAEEALQIWIHAAWHVREYFTVWKVTQVRIGPD